MDPEVHRILRTLDVDAALKRSAADGFIPDTREIALAGLHKARVVAGRVFTSAERKASREWLQQHGYGIPGALNKDTTP